MDDVDLRRNSRRRPAVRTPPRSVVATVVDAMVNMITLISRRRCPSMRRRRYPRVGVCRASRVSFRGKARACILTSHDSRNAMGTPGETKRNETSDDSPHSLTTTTTTTTAARVDAARSTRKNARSIPSLGRSRRSFGRFRRKGKSIHDASCSSRSSRSRSAFVEKCHRKRGRGVDRTRRRRRRRRNRNRNRNRREMCLTINHRRGRRNVKERGPEEEEATTTTTEPTARRGRSEAE